jgi:heme-degrading monooxygenase HmoA
MIARVTLAEVDAVRTSVAREVKRYEDSVIPELQKAPGYEGCYLLTTPEGKALAISFWDDEEAAERGLESGLYAAQVNKFVTVMRTPPGRETYDVSIADVPTHTMA